jgi:hypothetical protein
MKTKARYDKATRTGERRDQREGRSDRGRDRLTPAELAYADGIVRQMASALHAVQTGDGWDAVRTTILPMLRRVGRSAWNGPDAVELLVPPGLPTRFGVDLGPAMALVSPTLLETWGVDAMTLLGSALDNLRRRVVEEPPHVQRLAAVGIPEATVIQGQAWGSALVLVPDRLATLIGPEPRMLLAPVRNMLVALPEDVDIESVDRLWQAITRDAPDELDLVPLLWTGSEVTFGDEPRETRIH